MRASARWLLFGSVAIALAAAAFVFPQSNPVLDHRKARQLILYYTLSRLDDPIVVLGDSLTEASTLPRSLCGRPIVNAGLNAASTGSELGRWLSDALNGKRAAMIVVALGTNDALLAAPQSKEAFAERYAALIVELSRLANRVAVLSVPPVQQQDRLTGEMASAAMRTIDGYNSALPQVAARSGAIFVAMEEFPMPATIDGVHLNAAGYQVWDKAVMQAAAAACG